MPDFIDYSREALPPQRSGWGVGGEWENGGMGTEGELGLVHKMKRICKKYSKTNGSILDLPSSVRFLDII